MAVPNYASFAPPTFIFLQCSNCNSTKMSQDWLTSKFSTVPFRKYIEVYTKSISWQAGSLGDYVAVLSSHLPFPSLYFLLLMRRIVIISLLLLFFHRLSQMSSESDLEFRLIITLDRFQELVNKSVVAAMAARSLSFGSSEGGQSLWLFSKILHLPQSFSHLLLKDPRLPHSSLGIALHRKRKLLACHIVEHIHLEKQLKCRLLLFFPFSTCGNLAGTDIFLSLCPGFLVDINSLHWAL